MHGSLCLKAASWIRLSVFLLGPFFEDGSELTGFGMWMCLLQAWISVCVFLARVLWAASGCDATSEVSVRGVFVVHLLNSARNLYIPGLGGGLVVCAVITVPGTEHTSPAYCKEPQAVPNQTSQSGNFVLERNAVWDLFELSWELSGSTVPSHICTPRAEDCLQDGATAWFLERQGLLGASGVKWGFLLCFNMWASLCRAWFCGVLSR